MVAQLSERVVHPAAIRAGRARIPPNDDLERMGFFFKILGDPTRLRILYALHAGELCVCDLGETLDMSVSAVSHQLAVLKTARLVRHRREGKIIYYSLADDHVSNLLRSTRIHLTE
jgi:ArsR family transcriptional regulator